MPRRIEPSILLSWISNRIDRRVSILCRGVPFRMDVLDLTKSCCNYDSFWPSVIIVMHIVNTWLLLKILMNIKFANKEQGMLIQNVHASNLLSSVNAITLMRHVDMKISCCLLACSMWRTNNVTYCIPVQCIMKKTNLLRKTLPDFFARTKNPQQKKIKLSKWPS